MEVESKPMVAKLGMVVVAAKEEKTERGVWSTLRSTRSIATMSTTSSVASLISTRA